MRRYFSAASAACALGLLVGTASLTRGADSDNGQQTTVTGVLIDQACAGSMMSKADPEKAAEGHPKSCATKDACAKSGYAVISGKELLKFDAKGDDLAKDFLQKTDKADDLRVVVSGTRSGDQLAVTSITPAADAR